VPSRRSAVLAAAVALTTVLTPGCNRGAAEESLQVAEKRLEEARPELARYAPEKLAVLSEALRNARNDLEAGRYTRALRVAQGLPERIWAALALAERRKRRLESADDGASVQAPGRPE
jgi:hypothetical protein